jgi:hypothetical protein
LAGFGGAELTSGQHLATGLKFLDDLIEFRIRQATDK